MCHFLAKLRLVCTTGNMHSTPFPGCIVSPGTDQSKNFSDMQILRLYFVWYSRIISSSNLPAGCVWREAEVSPPLHPRDESDNESNWLISEENTYPMIPGDGVKCTNYHCVVLYSAKCTNTRKSAPLYASMYCIYDLNKNQKWDPLRQWKHS